MAFLDSIHAERRIDGFSKLSGTLIFFSFIRAIALKHKPSAILDFGAGRGAFYDDKEALSIHLRDLRFGGAYVYACDLDPIVKSHPCSQAQVVIEPNKPLPFEDGTFDLIVSDMTFEHIVNPNFVVGELLRVLKSGKYICARTTNKYGYVAIAARFIPNIRHASLLKVIQPNRNSKDVFPTAYRMNTMRQIKRLFAGCEVSGFSIWGEPSYYFGSRILYRMLLLAHRILPEFLAPTLCVFIQKR